MLTRTKTFENMHITPQQERFSELYFLDAEHLPIRSTGGATQTIAFALHNHEHRPTLYNYQLAVQPSTSVPYPVKEATITLAPEEKKMIHESIVLPSLNERAKISVTVTGGTQPHSIDYWTTITSAKSGERS